MTRYELLDRIGVGGMAEIFRGKAVAAGGFEKPVAIKRILPHLSQDKRFVELLIAEAKVLSLLKHRNIVQIFDVGLGDDGQYFLVMEYVDGKDLGAVQRSVEDNRRRMPFDLALHIGAEICEALEHAHSARAPDGKSMALVHRDVSPSNVLLSRAGEVKLTDFGIAKRAESEQTGSGAVRGKFAYISPEQARNEHVDTRGDVFSVAVLVWELVTNQRLFSKLGDLEALRAVREAKVRRATEADPRLASEVDEVLMPALSRDAKQRPTAGQLGAQLRELRYSLETTVGDPGTELAKIIDNAAQAERQSRMSSQSGVDLSDGLEHTVIKIHTADAFSMEGTDISAAREVIDRFEEEETRLAALSGDQLRMLRAAPSGPRKRPPTDAPTTTRPPVAIEDDLDAATVAAGPRAHASFDADESTRLLPPAARRTPPPERVKPASMPPLAGGARSRGPTNTPSAGGARRTTTTPPVVATNEVSGSINTRPPLGMPPRQPTPSAAMPRQPTPSAAMPQQPMPYGMPMPPMPQPPMPSAHGQYPMWEAPHHHPPPMAPRRAGLPPWVLIVGAAVVAGLAFLVTRVLIDG